MSQSAVSSYDPVAKTLHWLVALAVLVMFASAMMMELGEDVSPATRSVIYTTHKSTGFLVLFLMLIRLFWIKTHATPRLPVDTMPHWQVVMARIVLRNLYVLAILTPLVGWMLVSMGSRGINFYGLFTLPKLPVDWLTQFNGAQKIVAETHGLLAGLFAILIAIHIGASFLHHFIEQDDVLLRISPACLHGWLLKIRGTTVP